MWGHKKQIREDVFTLSGPLKSSQSIHPDLHLQPRFLSFSSEGIGVQPHSQPSICPWIGPVTFLIAFNEKSTQALEGRESGESGDRGWRGTQECSTKSAFHWSGKPRLLTLPPHSLILSFLIQHQKCAKWLGRNPQRFSVDACVCLKCHTKGQVSCCLRWQRCAEHKANNQLGLTDKGVLHNLFFL